MNLFPKPALQLRDAAHRAAAQRRSIVDGAGIKKTLERRVIQHLAEHTDLLRGREKSTADVRMDRLGMAGLEEAAADGLGDVPFSSSARPGAIAQTIAFFAGILRR